MTLNILADSGFDVKDLEIWTMVLYENGPLKDSECKRAGIRL